MKMKKLLLITALLITSSCYQMFDIAGCGMPSAQDKEAAKWFYKNASIAVVNLSSEQNKNMFGCHFEAGDEVYSYKNFWNKGYILVRDDKVITYYKVQ